MGRGDAGTCSRPPFVKRSVPKPTKLNVHKYKNRTARPAGLVTRAVFVVSMSPGRKSAREGAAKTVRKIAV